MQKVAIGAAQGEAAPNMGPTMQTKPIAKTPRYQLASWGLLALAAACGGDSGTDTGTVVTSGSYAQPPAAGSSVISGAKAGTGALPNTNAGRPGVVGAAGTLAAVAGGGASGSGSAGTPSVGAAGTLAANAGSAATAGSGGASAPPPSSGGFPKTDDVSVTAVGPYTVKTYSDGIANPTYASSMMYYPDGGTPPFASVAFTPGFTATKEDYTFLGQMLASHGIVALLTSPTSTSDQPQPRGADLQAAVKQLQDENTRSGSPLEGKLATDRICVTGHSMGGGGTLWAANALGDQIRCAVPLQPWQPSGSFPKVTAPTLIIGAESDTIAGVAANASPHYMSIPASTEKILAVFKGKDHFFSTNRLSGGSGDNGPAYDSQASYIIPFYKLFLEDDERYRPYLYGDMRDAEALSDFQHSKD